MKKLFAILTACFMLTAFVACGNSGNSSSGTSNNDSVSFDGSLENYMTALYDGIDENNMPAVMTTPITEEMEEFFLGTTADFKDAVASDAMINAIAHSVCLVRAENADKAAELAKLIEEKANPTKWVCVEAEKKVVKQRGNLVLLVMSNPELTDSIVANFDKLEA